MQRLCRRFRRLLERVGGARSVVVLAFACGALLPPAARAAGEIAGGFFALDAQLGEVLPPGDVDRQRGSNWGLGVGADYEWRHARIGGTLFFGGGGTWGSFAMRGDVGWLPLEGTWTPYLGGGAGVMLLGQKAPDDDPGEHLAPSYMRARWLVSLQAGVEMLRGGRARLLVGGQLDLPFSRPSKIQYPVVSAVTRITF